MSNCLQTKNQSVLQHGISVMEHTSELIKILQTNSIPDNWSIPEWMIKYRENIFSSIYSWEDIEIYTKFHDCGKPYCLEIDSNGNRHFPNHAEISASTWRTVGNERIARLIAMDMHVHQMKACDIDDFIKQPEAITLLVVALAEVHSNASMFGGIDSTSFKIKMNQINRRGKAICIKLFGEKL